MPWEGKQLEDKPHRIRVDDVSLVESRKTAKFLLIIQIFRKKIKELTTGVIGGVAVERTSRGNRSSVRWLQPLQT